MSCGCDLIVRKHIIITDARNNIVQNFYREFEQSLIERVFEVSMMPYLNDQPSETYECGYIAICSALELKYIGHISRHTLFGDPETTLRFFNYILNKDYSDAIPLYKKEIIKIIKVLEFIKNKSGIEIRNVRASFDWYQGHCNQFDRSVSAQSWFAGIGSSDEFIEFAANEVNNSAQQVKQVAIIKAPSGASYHWFAVEIDKFVEHTLHNGGHHMVNHQK